MKIMKRPQPIQEVTLPPVDKKMIRKVIESNGNGYLAPEQVQILLDAAGINRAKERVVFDVDSLLESAREIGYPIVM